MIWDNRQPGSRRVLVVNLFVETKLLLEIIEILSIREK